ncbi:metalloregulator ArsR/SmtB family transcription factor [Lysinibacillus louembei]|uniref:Metalloregulator ArsR/SmtB family transcription factor n=1 Tax=Lysinibacillus louembei TaxID=1470088 RepID=A0ABZ0RSC6_9BACI|nr:metalloregulator ArsR/SmtB family transcription factor [Lysinibacillus louembei]WPK10405.1 metalloregulator ArsR/SmtB family transcription factor [Lysinibacillus louembei]
MPNLQHLKNEFAALSDFLVALGDEKRQAIIIALLENKACEGLRVNDLTEVTNLSRPAISHHLKILKQANLVDYRSEGTKNYYYLSHDTTEIDKMKKLLDHVTAILTKE